MRYRQEMRRCNKPACRACKDRPSHGPYWYSYWRDEAGRSRKRYIGKSLPEGGPTQDGTLASPGQSSTLRIRVLGELEIESNCKVRTRRDWRRASARRLFALLLLHPTGLTREQIVEILWPERDSTLTRPALRSAMSALRLVLDSGDPVGFGGEGAGLDSRVSAGDELVRLRLRPDDWVDVRAFESNLHPEQLSMDALTAVLDLYHGDLFPEFLYEDWTSLARASLRRRWYQLSLLLAQKLVDDDQLPEAINRLEAVLAVDGTQEEAARLLMTVLAKQGHRTDALQVYGQLARCLVEDLDVEPEELSTLLADQIRREAPEISSLRLQPPDNKVERFDLLISRLTDRSSTRAVRRHLAHLWVGRAQLFDDLGLPEEALVSIASGHLVVEAQELPVARALLHITEAHIQWHGGHPGSTEQAALIAEEIAEQVDSTALVACAQRLRSQAAQQLGNLDQAVDLARSSTALFDSLGSREHALRSRRILALNVWYAGRYAEAERLHRHNLVEAREAGSFEHRAYVLCGIGSALRERGHLDEAHSHLLEALRFATALNDQFLILSVQYHLANVWTDRACPLLHCQSAEREAAEHEGERYFHRVISLARCSHSDHMLGFAALDLAVALARWGRPEEAMPLLAVARSVAGGNDSPSSMRAWVPLAEAEIALAQGNAGYAESAVTGALPVLERIAPGSLAQAHRVAALARSAVLSDEHAAQQHWNASLGAALLRGQELEEARTHVAMRLAAAN